MRFLNSANISKKRGFLELKKFGVYLAVPVGCVYLYNHEWFHPYFARHAPAPALPDDTFDRTIAEMRAQRAAAEEKKAAKAAAKQ